MSHRPNSLVLKHPGRRWARPDSADLIGPPASGLTARYPTAGTRAIWLAFVPARFNSQPYPTSEKELEINLATPPQPHVRKKLESRLARDNRLRLEWIADGFTD
jgi:hypothetical protein